MKNRSRTDAQQQEIIKRIDETTAQIALGVAGLANVIGALVAALDSKGILTREDFATEVVALWSQVSKGEQGRGDTMAIKQFLEWVQAPDLTLPVNLRLH